MSNEIPLFFKGVKFKELKPGSASLPPHIGDSDKEVPEDNPMIIDMHTGQHRYERPLWSQDGLIADFFDVLAQMRSNGVMIPTSGREILFVNRQALVPDAVEARENLVNTYGLDILRTIVADCARLGEGQFILRVGFRGQEHVALPSAVMSFTAHEYGHTLGENLPPEWEEMKAFAFESFFMSRYMGAEWDINGDNSQSTHDVARSRISQLNQKGVHNLEILSHLADYGFGQFGPKDYARHVGIRGRLMGKITRHSHA